LLGRSHGFRQPLVAVRLLGAHGDRAGLTLARDAVIALDELREAVNAALTRGLPAWRC
jgi:hypothetical protein